MKQLGVLVLIAVALTFIFCSSEQERSKPKGTKFLSTSFEETLAKAAEQNKIIMVDVFSDG